MAFVLDPITGQLIDENKLKNKDKKDKNKEDINKLNYPEVYDETSRLLVYLYVFLLESDAS